MGKATMWLLIGIGGTVGGFIPVWLGASYFSLWGILGSGMGSLAGLYVFNQLEI